jgi:WD40 repeat protein
MYSPVSSNPNKALGAIEDMVNFIGQGDQAAALAVADNSPDLTPEQREGIRGIIRSFGLAQVPANKLKERLVSVLNADSTLGVPPEDFLKILCFLDMKSIFRFSRTCEHFNQIVQGLVVPDNSFWKEMYDRCFSLGHPSQDLDFYNACKNARIFEVNTLGGHATSYPLAVGAETLYFKKGNDYEPWDFQGKELLQTVLTLSGDTVWFATSGEHLYSLSRGGPITVCNSKGIHLETLPAPGNRVCKIVLSKNYLVFGCYNDDIEIWSIKDKKIIKTIRLAVDEPAILRSLAISDDEIMVYAGLHDGTIQILDIKNEKVVFSKRCHERAVTALISFNNRLYSASDGGLISVRDSAGNFLERISLDRDENVTSLVLLNHRVLCALSKSNSVAYKPVTLHFLDLSTNQQLRSSYLEWHEIARLGVVNGILYARFIGGNCHLWDFMAGSESSDSSDSDGSDVSSSYESSESD